MSWRGAGIVAISVMALALMLDVIAIVLYVAASTDPDIVAVLDPTLFPIQLLDVGPFVIVGGLLVARRPENPIGRLLLVTGSLLAIYVASHAYAAWDVMNEGRAAAGPLALLVGFVAFYAMSGIIVPRLLLLFPDGRLPGPRWRAVFAAQAVVVALLLVVLLTPGDLGTATGIGNPLGIDALGAADGIALPLLDLVVDSLTVICGISLIVRFRGARSAERTQLKWFAWFGILAAVSLIGHALLSPIAPWTDPITFGIGGVAAVLLPVAIGVAVMRYHLYEIDRLISRSIGWAIVTGLLVGAFVILVLGLTSVLEPLTGGSTLAVAGSTLGTAALFQPIRRRVQRAVDRRFDRGRYDGERLLAAFGERLRYEVDLETISADVLATVDAAVRPASAGLWLRGSGAR